MAVLLGSVMLPLTATLVTLSTPAAVHAAGPSRIGSRALPHEPAAAAAARAAAQARVDTARAAVETGRVEAAVIAAAGLGGLIAQPVYVASDPVPPKTPAAIAGSVGHLLAAERVAAALVRSAVRPGTSLPPSLLATILHADGAVEYPWPGDATATSAWHAAQQAVAELGASIDRARILSGALTVAAAIDSELPALESYAATLAPSHLAVSGCDVVDDTPLLCIGGNGDNTYTQDEALLIDLGGNNTYHNSAGGADLGGLVSGNPGSGNGLPVSVNIDLGGGNDTYSLTGTTSSGAGVAQGAGNTGIGILVDDGGNNTYAVTAAPGAGLAVPGPGVAAGQGWGEDGGIGVLEDLGSGNDTYLLDSTGQGDAVAGQGAGSFGVGVLTHHGGGSDTFRALAHRDAYLTDKGLLRIGGGIAVAQGYASAGGAIFNDGGGTNTMTAAVSSSIPADTSQPLYQPVVVNRELFPGQVFAGGVGYLGGGAVALTGPGSDTWAVTANATAPYTDIWDATGLGYGIAGFGALDAEGQGDSYTLAATTHADRRVTVADGCGCTGANATAAGGEPITVQGQPFNGMRFPSVMTGGLGYGTAEGGIGYLHDTGAGNRFVLAATATAEAVANDQRSATGPGDETSATATSGVTTSDGEGTGDGSGEGFLVDDGGHDTYLAITTSQAAASAQALSPGVTLSGRATSDPAHTPGFDLNDAQAASAYGFGSYGELIDGGGSNAFSARSIYGAVADPPTEEVGPTPADVPGRFQAAVTGSGADAVNPDGSAAYLYDDGGGPSTYLADPYRTPCVGVRGQGVWVDCDPADYGLTGIGITPTGPAASVPETPWPGGLLAGAAGVVALAVRRRRRGRTRPPTVAQQRRRIP
ncbi:MAG: autotransporter outer membrane beta-barrel domain-containing protein [Candidatus Dormibacteria bacterium]